MIQTEDLKTPYNKITQLVVSAVRPLLLSPGVINNLQPFRLVVDLADIHFLSIPKIARITPPHKLHSF